MKIDVEGAEALVLDGACKIASENKTRFLVEMHSSPDLSMEDNARKIITWCRTNMYTPWYLKKGDELTAPSQIAHRGRCHLLLLPKKEPYPSYLNEIEQGAPLQMALDIFRNYSTR